jgi:hypothetical protein
MTATLTEITTLKTRLLALPAKLADARLVAETTRVQVEQAKDAWKEAQAEVALLIAGETNGDAKPKFSNEAARKAEATRRLVSEPAYVALAHAVSKAEAERIQASIEVQRLEDEHRAVVAVKDLTVAEVDLLIHGR